MRRTVVTGIGIVAPGGTARHWFWENILAGRTAMRRITFFDASGFRSQIAAECDFDPHASGLDDQEIRRMDRHVQFGVAASLEAMKDSGLDLRGEDPFRMSVAMGTALGGATHLEEEYVAVSNRGREWLVDPEYASRFLYGALVPSTLASEISHKFGTHGPAIVIATGSCAGMDAIGYGHQLVQDGEADIVIAGGSESPISPIALASFDPIKATSHRNDDPAHASRPFDRDRDGFVLGEGSAVLILEEMEGAITRGAHVYCEIAAFASRNTAYHMIGLRPDGLDLADAISAAMHQAAMEPQDVDYICAHGAGTKQSDRHETAAYKTALGECAYSVPISSIKSMIGHSLGAAGAISLAACALAIDNGMIPPTANWQNRDPDCDLDYTTGRATRKDIDVALSVASSFGGFQSAMIVARPREAGR